MKFRGLLVAVAVLAILGGVLYWSGHHKPHVSRSEAEATPTIIRVNPTAITSMTVKLRGAPAVQLEKKSEDDWQITAPIHTAASSDTVTSMLLSLVPLNAQRVVVDHATDLAQFGLTDPTVELDMVSRNNKKQELLLGDDTPTGDAVYAAVPGDPRVFLAPTYIKSSVGKSLNDLRDKRLVPMLAPKVTSIDLERKGQNLSFGRVQNGWQMEKPQPYRTDTYEVGDLVQQVTSAQFDPTVSEKDAAQGFAKGTPVATVNLSGNGQTDTLEVRKNQADYYATSSAMKGTWKVDPTNAEALDEALTRGLDGYRNKQLLDFGYADPEKIEYHGGGISLYLSRTGNVWWSDGKKMDADSVESLVTALRGLAATTFVDTGFTNPQIEVTVTSGQGKTVEKLVIQKTSHGGLAKRDDGPSIYSLDSVTLNSLTSAASGIKPAAPKKK